MNINLICIGKYSLQGLNSECERYKKMLSKFCKLDEILIKENILNKEDKSSIEKKIALDDELVLKRIKPNTFTILLDDEGKSFGSIELSKELEKVFHKNSNINVVIGGSYGVGEKVKKKSDLILSMSKLTFSHEIARLVFYEQLFRVFKILKRENYNK